MQIFWTILAAANLLFVLGVVAITIYARRRIGYLGQVEGRLANWPFVSIVVAARDEQRHIAAALRSLACLDYENYEVILVEDRSTDATGQIAHEVAAESRLVRVLSVTELPAGWLGKNHALNLGAQQARGEFLLFTDADVVLDPTTLQRAVVYAEQQGVDHLTLAPRADVPGLLLQAFVVLFTNLFLIYTRPWKVADPRSTAHIGIGAFNLVRRTAYIASGTHQAIAMRPDDDLKLGKRIKQSGFRQQILNGVDWVRVPWYESLGDVIRGMEKNAFSGVDYSIAVVVAGTATLLTFSVWPFLAVWFCRGVAQGLYGAVVLVLLTHAWLAARDARVPGRAAVLYPVAALLLAYIQWRAMLLTFIRGGIQWRGTFYPLAELRENRV